mmetsp:Transcript_24318/g.58594  ORF Transcript_24318/g.58594 Transcript_24318/m.58594 type:complete len:85 (-) Transcript_24318:102-356(-)
MQCLLEHEEPSRSALLKEVQSSWRQVFVDALQPTHLPLGWDIHHDPSVHNPHACAPHEGESPTDKAGHDFIDARLHNSAPPPST